MGHPIQLSQKMAFFSTLKSQQIYQLPVTSQNNQLIKFVKEQRVDQTEHRDFVGERSKYYSKCQTATRVHTCQYWGGSKGPPA